MSPFGITVVLTLLAAVVVVLTRLRMAKQGQDAAGQSAISMATLNVHTGAGTISIALWATYLLAKPTVVGWVAIGFWWLTTLAGLMVLARWLPAHGRHSTGPTTDTWGEGPGLSILAHIGMLVGAIIFTVFLGAGQI